MEKIRFSIIDYLNALPLNMAFKDGLYQDRGKLIFDYPSQCADNLAAGRCDVGLISTIEYQRIPNLLVAPQICIASRREVRSVLLITKKPLIDVHTVALDRFSRSSVALVQILFHRRFQRAPHFVTMSPSAEDMLKEADAALIIGDAALFLEDGPETRIDLAAEWFGMTGLPFVFAFWAMRPHPETRQIASMLKSAKEYGLEQLPNRTAEIQARWPLSKEDIHSYFSDNIHYDLDAPELEGLNLFYRYAEEAGLIHHHNPVRFA